MITKGHNKEASMSKVERVFSGVSLEEEMGYCRALRLGDRIIVSGTAPIEEDGSVANGVAAQSERCFDIISSAIRSLGGEMHHVVKVSIFLRNGDDFPQIIAVHKKWMGGARPACTGVVTDLLDDEWLVEIEVEAALT